MSAVYLRLSAPLQSWAGRRLTGNIVRTEDRPTASALKGLVAASLGAVRGEWPTWLDSLTTVVRTDQAGSLIDEFQTINPRDEDVLYQQRMYRLLTGKNWGKSAHFTPDGQSLTSIVRRTYLANAEFLVEFECGARTSEIALALSHPRFATYLGRKAFAPTFPYYLGMGESGLLAKLPTLSVSPNTAPATARLRRDFPDHWDTVEVDRLPLADWMRNVREQLPVRLDDEERPVLAFGRE